jgi:hypothetical protein
MSLSYREWSAKWAQGRQYTGDQIPEKALPSRIESVINLWNVRMPLAWERGNWTFLKERGFRRGDENDPQPEHKLERDLFGLSKWEVTGATVPMYLYPELNEISFGNKRNGQRKIDVLALLEIEGKTTPLAIEMKGKSTNNCWFAVVESLQQLRLLRSYPQSRLALNPLLKPFEQLPLSRSWGMVLAPPPFFDAKGQKHNSFRQAKELARALQKELGIVILLAAFNKNVRGQIDLLSDVPTLIR